VGLLLLVLCFIAGRIDFFERWYGAKALLFFTGVGTIVGVLRILMGFYEVNAHPLAKAHTFTAFMLAHLRARVFRKRNPKRAAVALDDLGEFVDAAELLLGAGFIREAAAEFLRAGETARAARLFERAKDVEASVKAYLKVGDPRAALVALEAGHIEDAAQLFMKFGQLEDAAAAWHRAGKPLEAANAFEGASRPEDAGNEILRALEDPASPFAKLSADDRRALAGRAAAMFERAGAAWRAAGRFEALGELELAQKLFEHGGDLAEAARVASRLGDHDWAAELYTRAGRTEEAAKERGEALLEADKTIAGGSSLSNLARADEKVDETQESLANAARCFEAAGQRRRAADLYARAGDLPSAARLFEQVGAWREAALCFRELGDLPAAARVLEPVNPIAAAETWAAAGKPDEAIRILERVPSSSPFHQRAVAMIGDVHLAAGRETEAAGAFVAAIEGTQTTHLDLSRVAHAIDALARMGRLDNAIEQLARMKNRVGEVPELEKLRVELDTRKRTGQGGQELVGCVIDRYQAKSLLGEGGTAWVYNAEHTVLGRTVALKVLKPHPSSGTDLAGRFYAEAQATAELKHPNVIHVFDVGATPGGLLYMALELVEGSGLRKLLEKLGRIPVPESTRILSGVLAGLSTAHAKGVVHRDLKPENILLTAAGEPKVVDFGIAKVLASKVTTLTGTFLGTPKYASPEQAQGLEATAATDIYASALVLYEMLAGRGPFESETPLGFLTKHATTAPLPLREVASDVPVGLADAVMKALEKDPAQRWPNAEAFRLAIAPFSIVGQAFDSRSETMVAPHQQLRQAATMVDESEESES
jgi:tetratricopeptide (TPR) repeat protein